MIDFSQKEVIQKTLEIPPGYEIIRYEFEEIWNLLDVNSQRFLVGEFLSREVAIQEAWKDFDERFPFWQIRVWLWTATVGDDRWWGTIRSNDKFKARDLLVDHLKDYLLLLDENDLEIQLWESNSQFNVAEGYL